MFFSRACTEVSLRDLPQRVEQRSFWEISFRDLAWRSLIDTLYRDLAQRSMKETHHKDLNEGNLHCISLHRTFYISLQRDLAQQFLQRSRQLDLEYSLLQTSEIFIKENVQNLPFCSLQHCLGSLAGISVQSFFNQSCYMISHTHTGGRIHTPSCFDWKL